MIFTCLTISLILKSTDNYKKKIAILFFLINNFNYEKKFKYDFLFWLNV